VDRLLIGNVAVDDTSLTVSVELLDVGSGDSIWTNTYAAKSSEVLAIQRRLTADVMRELDVVLKPEDLTLETSHHTENKEAYSDYMMGRYFFNKRTKDDFHRGIEYFRRAIQKDPSYAPAYAGIADCYGLLGAYMVMEADEAFTSARNAATRALELDEGLAEAHTSLALVHWLYDWDWAAADNEFRKAIELKPGYVLAHHWRGLFLGEMGHFSEAEAELQKALEYDPLSAPVYADYGRVLYWARRYDEALEKYRIASDMNPDFGSMRLERELLYEQLGRVDDWAASAEQGDAETRDAYRKDGPRGVWMVWYQKIAKLPGASYTRAEALARIGDKDRALENLADAIKMRNDHRVTQIKVNPVLDSLRSDPRFPELLRRMNLKPGT